MKKPQRLGGSKLNDSDIDEYCSSVEETLTRINVRHRSEESRNKTKKELVYCLEDILYY